MQGLMIEWLLAPIDVSRPHEIGVLASWHARLMVLAWTFLFPLGILAARYFKIMPGQDWPDQLDNLTWWRTHLVLQYGGGIAVVVAVALILQVSVLDFWHLHHVFGWLAVGLCSLQFLLGWFRGSKGGPTDPASDGSWSGDHYDMTPRRKVFEYCHKSAGYIALFSAVAAIATGFWFVNAPRWMWIATLVWWAFLVACFVVLQRRGWAIDTYQAIWGPNPHHPGNRMRPIGWGVSRKNDSGGSGQRSVPR